MQNGERQAALSWSRTCAHSGHRYMDGHPTERTEYVNTIRHSTPAHATHKTTTSSSTFNWPSTQYAEGTGTHAL